MSDAVSSLRDAARNLARLKMPCRCNSPLVWSGVVEGSHLRVVDEWQDVAVTIDAPGASQLWIAPIETISESEEGFERVYQGSQILAVWPAQLHSAAKWNAEAILHVTPARKV